MAQETRGRQDFFLSFVLPQEIMEVSAISGDEEKNVNRRAPRDRRGFL
jgi:hypothetical protein